MFQINKMTIFFEENFTTILITHILVSLFLAYFLHFLLKKRFISNNITTLKDLEELKEINPQNFKTRLLKFLFQFSFHKYNHIYSIVFLFFLNFSMPLFGYIASLWIVYFMVTVKYKKTVQTTHTLNLDEFETIFNETKRIFGESSLIDIMTNDYVPKSKKLQALASLSNNINPTNLHIIQETLKSKEDEIRLFGYAILNKEEHILNNSINETLEKLRKEEKAENKNQEFIAIMKKQLASLYWEMVYNGFAQDVLEKEFLKTIENYALESEYYFKTQIDSLKIHYFKIQEDLNQNKEKEEEILQIEKNIKRNYEKFIDLQILIGKIHMRKHNYQEAIEAFTLAIETSKTELNNNLTFLYPYIAEIYFQEKRYHLTKNILKQAQNLEFNTKLYPIIQQWRA